MKTNMEIWNNGQLVHSLYTSAVAIHAIVQDPRLWEIAQKTWEIYEEITKESHE